MLPKAYWHKMDLWRLPLKTFYGLIVLFLGFIQISFYIPIFLHY